MDIGRTELGLVHRKDVLGIVGEPMVVSLWHPW